jgi:hypothetical protein
MSSSPKPEQNRRQEQQQEQPQRKPTAVKKNLNLIVSKDKLAKAAAGDVLEHQWPKIDLSGQGTHD